MKVIHSRLTAEGIEINYPVRKLVFPSENGTASGSAADSACAAISSRGIKVASSVSLRLGLL